jgi:hypothetical protein
VNAWLSFSHSITCFEIWYNLCYDINFGNCYRHLVLQWSGVQISCKVFKISSYISILNLTCKHVA